MPRKLQELMASFSTVQVSSGCKHTVASSVRKKHVLRERCAYIEAGTQEGQGFLGLRDNLLALECAHKWAMPEVMKISMMTTCNAHAGDYAGKYTYSYGDSG